MTFRQFAFKNISRNINIYLAYFLSSTFSVMIFFTFSALIFHPHILNSSINNTVRQGIIAAEWIIYIFSFLFVLYSISIFLKARNSEFGTYIILGMSKKQLNNLVFIENMTLGILAIIVGIAIGLIFLKFFLLIVTKVFDIQSLSFYFPLKGFILTSISFFILFLIISILTILFIRTSKIISLLRNTRKSRKEIKASNFLSLFSIICLLTGYYLASVANLKTLNILILPVTFIVTIGTFFFYSQLSFLIIKLLKYNRKFYMKNTNMLWIADLAYRIKDNARMLFLVTIILAVAFTSITTLYLWNSNVKNNKVKDLPFAITYVISIEDNGAMIQNNLKFIEKKLKEGGFKYKRVNFHIIQQVLECNNIRKIGIIKLSEYNKVGKILGLETVILNKNEGVLVPRFYRKDNQKYETKLLNKKFVNLKDNNTTLRLTRLEERNIVPYGLMGPFIIVQDELFQNFVGKRYDFYEYDIKNWEKTYSIALELKKNKNLKRKIFTTADYYKQDKQTSRLLLLIGLFIGIIFFITSGSFLYFRFYTDFTHEKERFLSISKLGLTHHEIKKIITIHMALLFFIPYILACIHTVFALKPVKVLLTISMGFSILKILGSFLLIQILYFLIIRSKYINLLLSSQHTL